MIRGKQSSQTIFLRLPERPKVFRGHHFRDLIIEVDLPKVLYLLKGRRDIEIDFAITPEPSINRRYVSILDPTKDDLQVQMRANARRK